MARARSAVTIADVARRAGVSVGTVSRVLNNAVNCGPELRSRVREAMEELHYVPNHAARGLKRNHTEQIALVIPDFTNPVYVQMAVGVQRAAAAHGYHLTLVDTDGDWAEEKIALQSLEESQVDGAILCSLSVSPSFVREAGRFRERVCVIGGLPLECPVDNVRVDSRHGVGLGVAHLVEGGRRRLAFINGTRGTVPQRARDEGFARALAQHGLEADEAMVAYADFTMAGGYRAVDELVARGRDFDGLFCANDAIALGALRRLWELGREVPGDVAVVGMDDIEMARVVSPSLTSVTLLAQERGRIACELLLERLARAGSAEPRKVTVVPRLIRRESTARA